MKPAVNKPEVFTPKLFLVILGREERVHNIFLCKWS
jgi:hypothetical protein